MRKESIFIAERKLMKAIAGQLFDQAPNGQPRKAEIIMQKVRDAFRKDAHNYNEFYSTYIEIDSLEEYIRDILFNIPEFEELNLSQDEFDNNVTVDDPNRTKYKFTSECDKETKDSWKSDFIDLDAFIRNVISNLLFIILGDTDCSDCINDKESKECKTCVINKDLGVNFKRCREPRGEYTFACTYNCIENKYICCEECKEKESCNKKCDGNSKECGLSINHREEKE